MGWKSPKAPPFYLPRLSPGGLCPPALLTLALWLGGQIGCFEPISRPVYNLFMRLRSWQNPAPAKVLLLSLDDTAQAATEGSLAELLRHLTRSGATQVVFNFAPPHASNQDFYRQAEETGNVVLGRRIEPFPDEPQHYRFTPTSEKPADSRLPAGAVFKPPYEGGVYRSQFISFPSGDSSIPALECVAAAKVLGDPPQLAGNTFLIDFRGGPGSLPHLEASRIAAGNLVPELIAGKCVLAGITSPSVELGLYTPTTLGNATFSVLEYQGHALNTLLCGRAIRILPPLAQVIALALLVSLSYLMYRLVSVTLASWLTPLALILYAGCGLLSFVRADLYLPVVDWLLAQLLLFLFLVRKRAVDLTTAFQRLLRHAKTRLQEKHWPDSTRDSSPPWSLVAHMLDQTLDLNRLIFLEADSKKKRVREILALHCSLDDIAEKRREYTRRPFTDVLTAKGPLRLKNFFKSADHDEDQYLTPLVFSGELLGFWALGISALKAASIPRFDALLREYTARISELLYQAKKATERAPGGAPLGRRILSENTNETYQNVNAAFRLIQHRLDTLEILINQLDSGILIYDIFGRLIQINQKMLEVLKSEDIQPFQLTALDFIVSLSDYDIGKAKESLRKVIVEDAICSFTVQLNSAPESRYVMRLKPLSGITTAAASNRVQLAGQKAILCELLDITEATRMHEMKTKLTERLFLQMRSDLSTIDLSASMIASPIVPPEHCRALGEVIHTKVAEAVQTVSECQEYLCLGLSGEDVERFPVDPLPLLSAAVAAITPITSPRNITLQVKEPGFASYVLASSERLQAIFAGVLEVLVKDATENSGVLVRFSEGDDLVAIDFSNTGFGVPNDVLQEYIHDGSPKATADFEKLRKAAAWVEAWGGVFEAVSGVGIGMHFTIHLVKFI